MSAADSDLKTVEDPMAGAFEGVPLIEEVAAERKERDTTQEDLILQVDEVASLDDVPELPDDVPEPPAHPALPDDVPELPLTLRFQTTFPSFLMRRESDLLRGLKSWLRRQRSPMAPRLARKRARRR